jgi:phosphate:Na+ symporter
MQLMLAVADKPLLGVGIGAGVTAVVQSSSAAIAVVQKLATSLTPEGLPSSLLTAAIPIVLGSNIGTTMTAQLASIGASRSAKRAAMVQHHLQRRRLHHLPVPAQALRRSGTAHDGR